MQHKNSSYNYKKLDSYSLLIVSKYLETSNDYINVMCVCKKFQDTTEKLRFNPIPITSMKLFPMIQTQYLYNKTDVRIKRKQIVKYEMWHDIGYGEYTKYNKLNIMFHYVEYTYRNRKQYGDIIPNCVNKLGEECFGSKNDRLRNDSSKIISISVPSKIISLSRGCFSYCYYLTSINLPFMLKSLGDQCFSNCESLKNITLPSTLTYLGEECFTDCSSLKTIHLPPTLTLLDKYCFNNCISMTSISLPTSIKILSIECFNNCIKLLSINLPPKLKELGDRCFNLCLSLTSVNFPSTIETFGKNCFYGCARLRGIPTNSKSYFSSIK
ncbi:Leucine rich repeat containing protein BspA family protein [Entamoeba marina]